MLMTHSAASEFDWPFAIDYVKNQSASTYALLFLMHRPARLIVSDSNIYSLQPNGVWQYVPDEAIKAEIRATDAFAEVINISKIDGMIDEIKISRRTDARPFEWINAPDGAPPPEDLVLAANGLVDVLNEVVLPLDGSYFATAVPAWEYDWFAECPVWLEKLGEWLDESYHPTLQQFMGYLLTPDTSHEKLLALIGASRGGKGTVTKVIEALVGSAHWASSSMNDLAGDFGLESMIDKRVIAMPDAHDVEVSKRGSAIERIKSITGNDTVSVNRKNKRLLNSVRIPAKLILIANRHPKFLDESGALAIRELVITFAKSFVGKEDRQLRHKLAAELPGIANWAMDGLRELRAQGHFTVGTHGKIAQAELAESQSAALRFTKEYLSVTGDESDIVPLPLAFEMYTIWALNVEGLSLKERRNKTDFKNDMIAQLQARGVGFVNKQIRWHDPSRPKSGKGERVRQRFTGVKIRPGAALSLE